MRPEDHPRPDLLIAAIHRRVALLPDGRMGRVQWVNPAGTRLKLRVGGRHLSVRADQVLVEPGQPGVKRT